MRFLFAVRPFFGHLHPMAPVARVLKQEGHEVTFATAAAFSSAVEQEGFPCVPAGHDPRTGALPGASGGRDWGETVTRAKLADLVAAAAATPWDVIVRDQTDFGALLAAELLEVPCATL